MGSTLQEQAGDVEFSLRQSLDGVDLFFELDPSAEELRHYRALFTQIAVPFLREKLTGGLIKRYPAITLTALVAHAGLAYDQGRYWDSFWAELGLKRDLDSENTLRRALPDLLAKFRLRDIPEVGGKYVMGMAMHAGIPIHCVDDLIDVVEWHIRQGRDATGAALFEWLTAPGLEYRLNGLDKPVRNFLLFSGESAVAVLDQIIEFLISTLEQSEEAQEADVSSPAARLPRVLLTALSEAVDRRPFLASYGDSRITGRIRRRRAPLISYSVSDDEVLVGVPYPDRGASMPWKLITAATSAEVYSESGWGLADGEHPPTQVTVPAPAREIELVHDASSTRYTVSVFEAADPLLLFTAEGRLIRRSARLPRGIVIAIHPKNAVLVDAKSGSAIQAIEERRTPTGWVGWHVTTIDLTQHNSILLRRKDMQDGPVRGVRSQGAPTLYTHEPVAGLFTPNGQRVHANRAEVDLPAHIGSEPVVWRVRGRRSDGTSWLSDDKWESGSEETTLDPFASSAAALLGRYEISVKAEESQDHHFNVLMAEGLWLDHSVACRLPVDGGLTECVTHIRSEAGLVASVGVVEFGVTDLEREIWVQADTRGYKLIVKPPYAEFRVDGVGKPVQWRTSALAMTPRDFEDYAIIGVRFPRSTRATIMLLDPRQKAEQTEVAERLGPGLFQLPTRRFTDTARRLGSGTLVAEVQEEDGTTHIVRLADVRPARLCEGPRLIETDLYFDRLTDIEDPAVWVWAATAPWQPVTRIEIVDGKANLPVELRDAGGLLVSVFADDRFVRVIRPTRPDQDAIFVAQSGWYRDSTPGREQLAHFLAEGTEPPLGEEVVGPAWAALSLHPWGSGNPQDIRVREGLLRILRRHPRTALEALGSSGIPPESMMALMIRSHLINAPFSTKNTLNPLPTDGWIGCMMEISDLPSLRERARIVAAERAETLAYLETQAGPDLMRLLRDGKLADPLAGIFDQKILGLHRLPPEQAEELFEQCRLVPGALLDVDTRTSATVDAFNRRAAWVDETSCQELPALVETALHAVRAVSPSLYELIRTRRAAIGDLDTDAHPWVLLSIQSLTFAAVARLDALGEFEYSPVSAAMRNAWAVMAEYFPAMVATDLLIAEALAAHSLHGDLIGEPK